MNATVKEVLRVVNRIRGAAGLPTLADLPVGRRRNSQCCPIANALHGAAPRGVAVKDDIYLTNRAAAQLFRGAIGPGACILDEMRSYQPSQPRFRWRVTTPSAFDAFVSAFDRGELPEYDETLTQ